MRKLLVLLLSIATITSAVEIGKTKLGGYGELHLNKKFMDQGEDDPAKFDFHRFVVMLGIEFNNEWSFQSEIELEHNKVEVVTSHDSNGKNKKSGYFILEQAYLQYSPRKEFEVRAGVMLYPMGLINEYHEPSTFSTVERPLYHKYVLPTTWFGSGIAVGGSLLDGSLRYDVLVTEGLDDRGFGGKGLRGGRQKGFYSELSNVFGVARLDYTGLPGLKLGGSFGLNENVTDVDKDHVYDRTIIGEFHAQYNGKGFRTSAEFATISYNAIEGRGGSLENTQGVTAELGYDIARLWKADKAALYPFVRYTKINQAGKLADDGEYNYSRIEGGLAFHPLKALALKVTVGSEDYESASKDKTTLDFGFGYDF